MTYTKQGRKPLRKGRKMELNGRTERNGEMAVRTMSAKAQKGYNETDPVTVWEDDGAFAIKTADGTFTGVSRRGVEEILEGLVETLWYAVMEDDEDDWGTGTNDRDEAIEMLKKQGHGLVAVISDNGDPLCIDEIRYEDIAE